MARIINGKTIPTDVVAKTITAETPEREQEEIMRIDAVDEYISTGDYQSYLRLTLMSDIEGTRDTFYFDVNNDSKLTHAFIQTTEANQKLLNKLMQLIQGNTNINEFISEIANNYFMKDLGYTSIKMK